MMQRHARISHGNPPAPLELKIFEGKQRVLNTLLVMYFLKYVFWIIFNPKKATDCSFKVVPQNFKILP